MKNVTKTIILLFIFGGMFMLAQALIIDEFTDETTEGNFTFRESGSKYRNMSIKEVGFIKNVTISLKGYQLVNVSCYQEQANESSSCGGLDTGNYSWDDPNTVITDKEEAYDSIWTPLTGAVFIPNLNSDSLFFVNYTKPENSFAGNWQIAKDNIPFVKSNSSLTECWEGFSDKVVLRINFSCYGSSFCQGKISWKCFNSDWITLSEPVSGNFLVEEAMWWFINFTKPSNLTIKLNNTLIYENISNKIGNFNGSTTINFTDELNIQRISCEFTDGTNCNISINFTSSSEGILEYSNINITQNDVPNATNVSITSLPVTIGDTLKGHANFSDPDNDALTHTTTFWYVNKTLILTANNTFFLLGGNVTDLANITFSAQLGDNYDNSSFVNSSTATVGDSTPPTFKGNRTNPSSVQRDSTIDIFVNATDASSTVDIVKAEIEDPNNIKINHTMSLDSGVPNDGEWIFTFITSVVGTHNVTFYADDGSGNIANTGNELTFIVTAIPVTNGDTGGGGGLPDPQCTLDLFVPREGGLITMFAPIGELTNPTNFIVRNRGNTSGVFNFEVSQNNFLTENCEFERTEASVAPGLDFTNNIKCKVDEVSQNGNIKITGCNQEKNYRLEVSSNQFLLFFSKLFSGDPIEIAGRSIPFFVFFPVAIVLIFAATLSGVAIVRSLTG